MIWYSQFQFLSCLSGVYCFCVAKVASNLDPISIFDQANKQNNSKSTFVQNLKIEMFGPLSVALFCSYLSASSAKNPIGQYNISDVTVSGISAGGYMAQQVHIALSDVVVGAGVFAGGPYFCAKDNAMTATGPCMAYSSGGPDVDSSISYTNLQSSKKTIGDIKNIMDDKVYLYSGTEDSEVDPRVMKDLEKYYQEFMPKDSIVTNFYTVGEHNFPTLDYGNACTVSKQPYISKCNLDGAGETFKTVYGDAAKRGVAIAENLRTFDQAPFTKSLSKISLGDTGYIYVPTACKDGTVTCHAHIAFHGCSMTLSDIGTDFVEHAGYNEWAEGSNIIVVYPFTVKSLSMPSNPYGCWDWWSYSGLDYALKTGPQIEFVQSIITEISSGAL